MENKIMISKCSVCCTAVFYGTDDKTFPIICPETNMPCFAISPEYLIPNISKDILEYMASNKEIPLNSKIIDTNFVDTNIKAYKDWILKRGL